jgi:hypothetical protein
MKDSIVFIGFSKLLSMKSSASHHHPPCKKPGNDFLRELYLENSARAITYTNACLCTSSPKQGLFCMKTGKGDKYNILLSSADEMLFHGNCEYELVLAYGNCKEGGRGLGYIRDLNSSPWPVIWYSIGALTFRKELFLSPTEPELMIRYTLEEGSANSEFLFKPFLAYRNSLILNRYQGTTGYSCQIIQKNQIQIKVQDPGYPRLWIEATGNSAFVESPEWRLGVKYKKEKRDNDYDTEDLYSPGIFKSSISPGSSLMFSISTMQQHHHSAEEFIPMHQQYH